MNKKTVGSHRTFACGRGEEFVGFCRWLDASCLESWIPETMRVSYLQYETMPKLGGKNISEDLGSEVRREREGLSCLHLTVIQNRTRYECETLGNEWITLIISAHGRKSPNQINPSQN
jgi:hypothetical protein